MSTVLAVSYVILWLLVIVQGLTIVGLVKVIGRIARTSGAAGRRAVGPAQLLGKPAPAFRATDLRGMMRGVGQGRPGEITTLLFVSPFCPLCGQALGSADFYASKTRGNLLVICHGPPDQARRLADDYHLSYPVLADEDGDVFELYLVADLPVAVQISGDGTVLAVGHEAEPVPAPAFARSE